MSDAEKNHLFMSFTVIEPYQEPIQPPFLIISGYKDV